MKTAITRTVDTETLVDAILAGRKKPETREETTHRIQISEQDLRIILHQNGYNFPPRAMILTPVESEGIDTAIEEVNIIWTE